MGNDSREYLRNRPLYEDSKIDTRYIFLRMILKREELAIKNKKTETRTWLKNLDLHCYIEKRKREKEREIYRSRYYDLLRVKLTLQSI